MKGWCERRDSNSHRFPRWNLNPVRLPIPPLSRIRHCTETMLQNMRKTNQRKSGVDEGDRTLDRRSHNPELYQLSYVHHIRPVLFSTSTAYCLQLCWFGDFGPDQTDDLMARPAGLEPATTRLEGGCSIQLSYGRLTVRPPEHSENGRGREIRTPDILLPKQARYQTALYPVN